MLTIAMACCAYLWFLGPISAEHVYHDWAECVLHKMPDVKNSIEAKHALEICKQNSPQPEKKGTGCGGYSIEDCVKKYAKGGETQTVLEYMYQACSEWHSAELKEKTGI